MRVKMAMLFFAALLSTACCLPLLAAELSDVRVFAHRGVTTGHPENSLAAVKAAIDLGIHGSEIDLRTTADGRIILMHDETLDRTTTGRGPVRGAAFEAVRGLKLVPAGGDPVDETVPLLTEVLDLVRPHEGFELALDLKDVDWTRTARMIHDAGLADRVWFFIPDPQMVPACREIKAVDPDLRLSVGLSDWWKIEGLPTFVHKSLDTASLFAPEWEFPRHGFDEAHAAGAEVQVYLWGVKDLVDRARRAAKLGADVISVDHPNVLAPLVRPRRDAADSGTP